MKIKNRAICFLAIFGLAFVPFTAAAQSSSASIVPCSFEENLETGSAGEAVRCLQKYLNSNGFKIADSGIGSPGNETSSFGALTREAVKRWQMAKGISPATGTFGPISKAAYLEHIKTLLTTQLQNTGSNSNPLTISIPTTSAPSAPVQAVVKESAEMKEARKLLQEARDLIEDTEDDIEDNDELDATEIENLEDDVADAKEELLDGLYAFIDEDYSEAKDKAEDIIESMEDIGDDLHGDDSDAEEAIEDARNAIEDAENEIDEAYDDGDEVDEARDLLEEAEEALEDAEDAFDDEDFEEAEEFANDAEELAEDAVDAIGN